ncbi:MAG: choice-of-anchor D domain-containing protein [Thioploca sp.]|nr:choice-of-anchor D domain-containing protein [Thioploca sp.]
MKRYSAYLFLLLTLFLSVVQAVEMAGWEVITPRLNKNFYAVWGSASNDVFAVGGTGLIFHYDGYQWSEMDSGVLSDFYGIWGTSGTNVFAVGMEGTILHYDGDQWITMNSRTSHGLSSIWGSSSTDVFAVGSNGTILHYDGHQWSTIRIGTSENLNGIWGSSSTDVFVVGNKNTIRHYDGNQWSAMKYTGLYPDDLELSGIWGSSSTDVFAWSTGGGSIFHYDGRQWTYNDFLLWLRDICGRSSTDVFAVGGEEGIHYDGKQWSPFVIKLGNRDFNWRGNGRAIWCSPEGDIFIVRRSYILRCTDCQLETAAPQITPSQTISNSPPDNPLEIANLQITPNSFQFQTIALGQPASQTFTVTNISNNAIPLPALMLTNTTDFTLNNDTCSNTLLTPAGTCQVNVNFQPQSEGQKLAKLSLPSNTTTPVEVSLDGSGCLNTLEQSFQFYPESPHFGTIKVNQSITLNPTIKFTATQGCGEVLQIETIQLAGRDATEFSLQNIQCSHSHEGKESSSTCQFNLIFKPSSPGNKQAHLTFKLINHEELPSSTIPFSAQAIMAEPEPLAVEIATTPSEPVSVELMPISEEESVEKEATTLSPVEVKPALETETDLEEDMIQPAVILPVNSTVNTVTPTLLTGITCDAATYTKALETCHLQHLACTYVDNHPATQCDAQKTHCEATARSGCYPLVITKSGVGTGTVQVSNGVGNSFNCDPLCQGQFSLGELVTLTAAADSGSVFQSWSGNCYGESTTTQVTIGSLGTHCTAVFEPASWETQFALKVTKVGNGTVTSTSAQINCDPNCSGNYLAGIAVELIATPEADSIFTQWTGACSGNSPTITVTLDADKTCTATFVPVKPYLSTTINCTPNPVASLQKLHCILTAELSHAAPTTIARNVKLITTLPEGLILTAINPEVGQCDISQLPQVTCQLNDLNRDSSPTKVTLDLSLQDPNLLAMTQTAEISANNYPSAGARARTFIAIPPEIQIDLAVVIDVNRSMQEKINGVKAELEKLITNMTTYQPPLAALIVFKDEVRIKTLTADRKVLLEAIHSLQTEGNYTCPTASAEAVEIAARHLQPGGQIFLGTDAPPYPDAEIESILTLLTTKNIHLNVLTMMGDCSMTKNWNSLD